MIWRDFDKITNVVEKLLLIVCFIHQEIVKAFEENGMAADELIHKYGKVENNFILRDLRTGVAFTIYNYAEEAQKAVDRLDDSAVNTEGASKKPERLGDTGLALHYANLISLIDSIASCPASLPPNMRDTLYNALPDNVKRLSALLSRLQALDSRETMTMPQIKAEMEKTLHWLVPVAKNTTKAHQSFGWVGVRANNFNEFGKETSDSNNIIRLQTLYRADKDKIDGYILDLVVWLHRLVSLVRLRERSQTHSFSPRRSLQTVKTNGLKSHSEDQNLLK